MVMAMVKKEKKNVSVRLGIRVKLIAAFMVPIVFIIILGIASYQKSSTGIIDNYESSTLTIMEMMSDHYALCFDVETTKGLEIVSKETSQRYFGNFYVSNKSDESIKYSELTELIANTINADNNISSIYLIGEKVRGVSTNKAKLDTDTYKALTESSDFKLLLDSKKNSVWIGSHPSLDQVTNVSDKEYGISNVRYLFSNASKKAGYLVLDIKYDFIYSKLEESNLPEGSIAAFITADGREIIYGAEDDFTFADNNLIPTVTEDETSGYKYINYNSEKYLYLYSYVPASESYVCALVPKNVITAQANQVKNLTFIIVAIASAIAIIFGLLIAQEFASTIKKANKTLGAAAKGDLTAVANLHRKDEFLILEKSINNMIDNMRNLIQDAGEVGGTVASSAFELTKTMNTLVKTTQMIHETVVAIEGGVSEQATEAENCFDQMNELSDQINRLHVSADQIAEIAEYSKKTIKSGLVAVDNLNQTAKNTTQVTQTMINDIEQLEEESSSISSIIDTIKGIASQTNLLSLNASIEAARAGEAGKGFAVVAEEIRKLAEQSADSTQKINDIIMSIQARTRQTAENALEAKQIVTSQETVISDTIHSFTDIEHNVERLTDNLSEISKGIYMIEGTKNETLSAIESISAGSQETAASTAELAITANEQLKAVEQLNEAANILDSDSRKLQDSIDLFKV